MTRNTVLFGIFGLVIPGAILALVVQYLFTDGFLHKHPYWHIFLINIPLGLIWGFLAAHLRIRYQRRCRERDAKKMLAMTKASRSYYGAKHEDEGP